MPIVNGTWVNYTTSFCENATYTRAHYPLACIIKTVTYNLPWLPILLFAVLIFILILSIHRKIYSLAIVSIIAIVVFVAAFLFQ